MSSTYSQSLRLELIGAGDQAGTWGTTTNNSFAYVLDTAIAGYQTVSVIATNQALTYVNGASSNGLLNESVYAILRLTTSTGANFNIYAPPAPKTYIVFNDSAYTATIYNSTVIGNITAAGVGIAVPAGGKLLVWSNGTNFYDIQVSSVAGILSVANGGTGQATQQAAINALAGTQTANRVLRSDGTNTTLSQVALATDVTGALPIANGGTGVTTIAALGNLFYPVGSIYTNVSDSTNPATLLGFGTWTAFSAGRVMVGFDSSNVLFDTPGETGGNPNAVVVSHTHTTTVTDPGHTHTSNANISSQQNLSGGPSSTVSLSLATINPAFTGITVAVNATGQNGIDANYQPYITVYMWRRTA
jgi:hypothetical protein